MLHCYTIRCLTCKLFSDRSQTSRCPSGMFKEESDLHQAHPDSFMTPQQQDQDHANVMERMRKRWENGGKSGKTLNKMEKSGNKIGFFNDTETFGNWSKSIKTAGDGFQGSANDEMKPWWKVVSIHFGIPSQAYSIRRKRLQHFWTIWLWLPPGSHIFIFFGKSNTV